MFNKNSVNLRWKFGFIVSLFQAVLLLGNPGYGQTQSIEADNTLGAESSRVIPLDSFGFPVDSIQGGAIRGGNLFHSFERFNVEDSRSAYFSNPSNDIQNIISRVTGGNPSEILGTLGVLNNPGITSSPNLIFSNPNGIVFGENASLDVGGSFIATTADAVQLGEQGFFSATEPENSSLLSVEPSALFLNAVNNQAGIVNRSRARSTVLGFVVNGDANRPINGLQVLDGKSLLLVGGDISFDGGRLFAPGGRVELGGLATSGTVKFNFDDETLASSFSNTFAKADVSLSNNSRISVNGEGGGIIAINSGNLSISESSQIFAGIRSGSGTLDTKAGDIILDATGTVNIENSVVGNDIGINAFGNTGNLIINANEVSIRDGGQVRVSTFGTGNTGDLKIRANKVDIFETPTHDGSGTGVFNQVVGNAINSGNLNIEAQRLTIRDGAQVTADTFGEGNAANVQLIASESIEIAGSSSRRPTFVVADVDRNAIGQGGNLNIETKRLIVRDGAQVATSTFGKGNAGNLSVKADEIEILGSFREIFGSGLFSQAEPGSDGKGGNLSITTKNLVIKDTGRVSSATFSTKNAGNLNIKADELTISDNGQVSTSTSGKGNAGNLTITTNKLVSRNIGEISASTFAEGNAGNLTVNASEIDLSGTSADASNSSSIRAQVNRGATGNAGKLTIETGKLILQDGAKVSSAAQGEGRGGNLTITASESVEVIGRSPNGRTTPSAIFARTGGLTENAGDGGDLDITTGRLIVRDGGQISASTFGKGDAGDLTIRAFESVDLGGNSPFPFPGGLFAASNPDADGDGGNLSIETKKLLVGEGAQVSVSTSSTGKAGNLNVNASESVEVNGISSIGIASRLLTQTDGDGNAGDVTISTKKILVIDGGEISAGSTGEKGNGGNLNINASELIQVIGESGTIYPSNLTATTFNSGNAGNSTINTRTLTIKGDNAFVAVDTFGSGNAGDLTINADELILNGGFISTGTFDVGNAGDLKIESEKITMKNKAFVLSGAGTLSEGKAGNVYLVTGFLSLDNDALINAQSLGTQNAGTITIKVGKLLNSNDSSISTASLQSSGGAIDITAKNIHLFNDSNIRTDVANGEGGGGNITLTADTIVALDKSDILSFALEGKGGDIRFNTAGFFSTPLYRPTPPIRDRQILNSLDGDDKVDVNASGVVSGAITGVPDITFIENSLSDLQQNPIDTNALIANSCIARSRKQESTFNITGAGGLPQRPGDAAASNYPTGEVQNLSNKIQSSQWKPGEPIIEPQGVYELPSGELILSRECS